MFSVYWHGLISEEVIVSLHKIHHADFYQTGWRDASWAKQEFILRVTVVVTFSETILWMLMKPCWCIPNHLAHASRQTASDDFTLHKSLLSFSILLAPQFMHRFLRSFASSCIVTLSVIRPLTCLCSWLLCATPSIYSNDTMTGSAGVGIIYLTRVPQDAEHAGTWRNWHDESKHGYDVHTITHSHSLFLLASYVPSQPTHQSCFIKYLWKRLLLLSEWPPR